ncbi:ABC transporter permease [Streptomyces sp. NBC_00669]|uniref:ABC transporter permease n=1 Tax=Streptomyces sp. NBC_00669 TaxID=2976011 RepID=UPI002E31131A|nr:ABC transporter permease [Streptomyces sp. NBC_00669]
MTRRLPARVRRDPARVRRDPARVRRLPVRLPANRKVRCGLFILLALVLVAAFGPLLVGHVLGQSPTRLHAGGTLEPPSGGHWLGTTSSGQDVLAQLVAGTRTSLLVGLVGGTIATVLAVLLGVLSGYSTGRSGAGLTAFVNIFLVIPGLPLLILVAGYTRGRGGWLTVAVIIGLTSWAGGARAKRAQTLSLRGRDFVTAATYSGESRARVLLIEVVPHLAPVIASTFLFSVVGSIAAEAGLDFIGAGHAGTVSWGTMLYWVQSQGALQSGAWWWFLPPGLCIALVGTAAGLINFGVDELADPRLRARAGTGSAAGRSRRTGGLTPEKAR